jgi:hypothetical protein
MSDDLNDLDIASDRLDGEQAIADFIGRPLQRTRYMIRYGFLPVMREGRRITASKRALRAHYARGTGLQQASAQTAA